jgi:hypothetical protein
MVLMVKKSRHSSKYLARNYLILYLNVVLRVLSNLMIIKESIFTLHSNNTFTFSLNRISLIKNITDVNCIVPQSSY